MKKVVLGLIVIIAISIVGFSTNINNVDAKDLESGNMRGIGEIRIKFHGGTLCWLPGEACKGEIVIVWNSPIANKNAKLSVPKGYQSLTMKTSLFKEESQIFEERTLTSKETSDGSTIYFPKQEGKYNKELDAFILYAKIIK